MGTLARLLVGGPIAAFVTIALFVIMYNLIIPDEVELGAIDFHKGRIVTWLYALKGWD